jgi:hypothetical protein
MSAVHRAAPDDLLDAMLPRAQKDNCPRLT